MKAQFETCYIPFWQSESIPYLITKFLFSETVFRCGTEFCRETYLIYIAQLIDILVKCDADGLYQSEYYNSAFYKY